MREFSVGQDGLLSWSPPVPPNGDICHYNVIISTATSGEVVSIIEEWEQLNIDVSNYGEINMDYNVTVSGPQYSKLCAPCLVELHCTTYNAKAHVRAMYPCMFKLSGSVSDVSRRRGVLISSHSISERTFRCPCL